MEAEKDLQRYLEGSYDEVVSAERGVDGDIFVARYPSLPGCVAQASSAQAALDALRRLRKPFIRHLFKSGARIAAPDHVGRATIKIGQVLLPQEKSGPSPFVEDEDPGLLLAELERQRSMGDMVLA